MRREGINRDHFRDFFRDYFEANDFLIYAYRVQHWGKVCPESRSFFPGKIERLILIAPDGLKINFWYNMATNTWLSRRVFRYFMEHPGLFLKFADMLTATRLIHPAVSRFAKSQMEDDRNRQLIYNSWVNFRTLNLDISRAGEDNRTAQDPGRNFPGRKGPGDRCRSHKTPCQGIPAYSGAYATCRPFPAY
jgi:hypothetical protein